MKNFILLACGTALTLSATADAALFSFASDTADRNYTFTGNNGQVTDATGPAPVILTIDDSNGVLARLEVSVRFNAQYSLTHVASVALPGGAFSHNYAAAGSFTFIDIPSGVTLLTTTFENALFTARGGADTWFTTGALQVDNSNAIVNMTWGGANLPGYQLSPGPLNGSPRGFGFDLTALNHNGSLPYDNLNPGVALNTQTRLPSQTWWSEGSYSSSGFVPSPSVAALLGLGALGAARRRVRA